MTPRHLIEPGRLAGSALLRAQSDARLVDLTRAGNDRAFEAIVDRYRRPLLRYCSRILPDGRGEDALQQVFLNAYGALHRDAPPASLRSWRQLISRARDGIRAAAASVVPVPLIMRLTDGAAAPPTAGRLAELTAAGGGLSLTKVVATAAVGGALIGGAVKAPDVVRSNRAHGDGNVAEASDDTTEPSDDAGAAAHPARRSDGGPGDSRHRGRDRDDAAGADDHSGRGGGGEGSGDDHGGDRSGSDEHSGSDDGGGSGSDDSRRDSNSGPGGGGDDRSGGDRSGTDGGGSDDHSGPGSGDTTTTTTVPDSSGSGGSGDSGISGSDGVSGGSDDLIPPPSDDGSVTDDGSGPGPSGRD